MPILKCGNCEFTFVYSGKSLGVRCPSQCGRWESDTPIVHVDEHRIETLNGHTLDGRYSGVGSDDHHGTEVDAGMARADGGVGR